MVGEHPGLPYSTTAEHKLVQPQGHIVLQGSRCLEITCFNEENGEC